MHSAIVSAIVFSVIIFRKIYVLRKQSIILFYHSYFTQDIIYHYYMEINAKMIFT